jgi:hypothetical protein
MQHHDVQVYASPGGGAKATCIANHLYTRMSHGVNKHVANRGLSLAPIRGSLHVLARPPAHSCQPGLLSPTEVFNFSLQ